MASIRFEFVLSLACGKEAGLNSGFFVVLELLAVSVFWHEAVVRESPRHSKT